MKPSILLPILEILIRLLSVLIMSETYEFYTSTNRALNFEKLLFLSALVCSPFFGGAIPLAVMMPKWTTYSKYFLRKTLWGTTDTLCTICHIIEELALSLKGVLQGTFWKGRKETEVFRLGDLNKHWKYFIVYLLCSVVMNVISLNYLNTLPN